MKKQFCKRGHDKYVHGVSTRGYCNQCRKENPYISPPVRRTDGEGKVYKTFTKATVEAYVEFNMYILNKIEKSENLQWEHDPFWLTLVVDYELEMR